MNDSFTKEYLQTKLRMIKRERDYVETKHAELIHQENTIRSIIDIMTTSQDESDEHR